MVPFMPSLASSRVPLTLKASKNDFSGAWISSKSSSRVNLYKAQIAYIFQDNPTKNVNFTSSRK